MPKWPEYWLNAGYRCFIVIMHDYRESLAITISFNSFLALLGPPTVLYNVHAFSMYPSPDFLFVVENPLTWFL